MRQGGIPVALTLSGDQIVPGANAVTSINGSATGGSIGAATSGLLLSSPALNNTQAVWGWLQGVYGSLRRTATGGPPSTVETYTFTPASEAGLPLSAPAGSVFTLENTLRSLSSTHCLWAGSNDVLEWLTGAGRDATVANVAAMVSALTGRRRFVVLGPSIQSAFVAGGGYHDVFDLVRAALAAAYPDNWIDIHAELVANGLSIAGITPTAQDLTDIANDIVPSSLRADAIHLNGAGYAVVAKVVADWLRAKRWF